MGTILRLLTYNHKYIRISFVENRKPTHDFWSLPSTCKYKVILCLPPFDCKDPTKNICQIVPDIWEGTLNRPRHCRYMVLQSSESKMVPTEILTLHSYSTSVIHFICLPCTVFAPFTFLLTDGHLVWGWGGEGRASSNKNRFFYVCYDFFFVFQFGPEIEITPLMLAKGLKLLCKTANGLSHALVRFDAQNRSLSSAGLFLIDILKPITPNNA